MKKQLLLVPLVGLLCFTSCNKSRELTPVDDKTGLERATTILEKENEIDEQVFGNSGDIKKLFDYFPNKFEISMKGVENEKARIPNPDLSVVSILPIIEESIDNLVTEDIDFQINRNTLQLHSRNLINPSPAMYREVNTYYDETNSTYFVLKNDPFVGKTKTTFKVANREEAENYFYNLIKDSAEIFDIILPTTYLENITAKNEDNEYKLLKAYETVQKEYFERFAGNDEQLKHQFGSDDEKSLSLKNDFKIKLNTLPIINEGQSGYIVADCTAKGGGSIFYNDIIRNNLIEFCLNETLGCPDLIVFNDYYVTYAKFTRTIDGTSAAQQRMPAGALYQHTTLNTTLEVTKNNVNIVNPNPDDYKAA